MENGDFTRGDGYAGFGNSIGALMTDVIKEVFDKIHISL